MSKVKRAIMEKLAAFDRPNTHTERGLIQNQGLAGKYIPGKSLDANPGLAGMFNLKRGNKQGLLAMSHKDDFKQAIPDPKKADQARKVVRRHELTHWMRDQKGKMKGMGEAGPLNVLRTVREEAAAHLSSMKAVRNDPAQKKQLLKATIPTVKNSVKDAYRNSGGVMKNLLKLR